MILGSPGAPDRAPFLSPRGRRGPARPPVVSRGLARLARPRGGRRGRRGLCCVALCCGVMRCVLYVFCVVCVLCATLFTLCSRTVQEILPARARAAKRWESPSRDGLASIFSRLLRHTPALMPTAFVVPALGSVPTTGDFPSTPRSGGSPRHATGSHPYFPAYCVTPPL